MSAAGPAKGETPASLRATPAVVAAAAGQPRAAALAAVLVATALAAVASAPGAAAQGAAGDGRAGGADGRRPSAGAAGTVEACLRAAGRAHAVDPAVLVILLQVEGGSLGRTSRNTNGTEDIGPMQINTIWVERIARRWRTTPAEAFLALRDSFCANVEAGAWILRLALDDARGDFWRGVGYYHSRTGEHRERYLRLVADRATRLLARTERAAATATQPRPPGGAADPAAATAAEARSR